METLPGFIDQLTALKTQVSRARENELNSVVSWANTVVRKREKEGPVAYLPPMYLVSEIQQHYFALFFACSAGFLRWEENHLNTGVFPTMQLSSLQHPFLVAFVSLLQHFK